MRMFSFLVAISLFTFARAVPQATPGDCVGTISSLNDVSAAVQCKTVNIHSFTVPAGETFNLNLLQGTTVNVLGGITFGEANWNGPLFEVEGEDITFNGNGMTWDGNGPYYWDGHGLNGGVTKPDPMMRIKLSGTLSNVTVVNSPARSFSIDSIGPLVVSDVTVDDRQGNDPNNKSDGRPAGVNTDGFDVSGNDVVIKNCAVFNQDDCLAINRGQNIIFEDNYCDGGHGVSIGSISSNTVVENIVVRGNTIVNSVQAIRIKTDKVATNSRVASVTYYGNVAKNCTEYGVLITQSYPDPVGDPGNGVIISDISFSPDANNIEVVSGAKTVAVNCGPGSCRGNWNWSSLQTSGGDTGKTKNCPSISGYTL